MKNEDLDKIEVLKPYAEKYGIDVKVVEDEKYQSVLVDNVMRRIVLCQCGLLVLRNLQSE